MARMALIVDDSATIRESVAYILRKAEISTMDAVDGVDALNKLTSKVDIIITDLNMPNMDGLTLIRKVREDGPNKYTPILMLTTDNQPEKKAEGKAAGATGWIVKPYNPETLLATVQKVLK